MRYCISDIHGEYELFIRLLEKIDFSDEDELFICGDIIDKGLSSVKLLSYIYNMPNARCIIGNHEYAFLRYYWSLMRASPDDFDGVLSKLSEYFPTDEAPLDWDIMDWLEGLPFYIEEKDFICVHAGVPLDGNCKILPLDAAIPEELVNDRRFKEKNVIPRNSKCVLFGHTPTTYIHPQSPIIAYPKSAEKINSSKISDYAKIHLDTGAWQSGILAAFCIDTCKAYYVNKKE